MRATLLLCGLMIMLASSGQAQQESHRFATLRGQIVQSGSRLPADLTAEIWGLNGGPIERVHVTESGTFEFYGLETGEYDLIITNGQADQIHREHVYVSGTSRPLTIQLRSSESLLRPRVAPAISAGQLLHPVPPKAVKELGRSQEAFRAGDIRNSIEHLEKAIKIHPNYMEAHNNLGARYVDLNQPENAVSEFQKALAIDPNSLNAQFNLSLAFCLLRRYPEAEDAARRALQLDRNYLPARYALGQILSAQEKNTPEALHCLRQAVSQFPNARLMLARVLVRQGAIDEAASELREYLKSPHPEKKQLAEYWLARLTEPPTQ